MIESERNKRKETAIFSRLKSSRNKYSQINRNSWDMSFKAKKYQGLLNSNHRKNAHPLNNKDDLYLQAENDKWMKLINFKKSVLYEEFLL